ncbi:hypothetical protein [Aminobacter sp. HY435]|uniref:hypothetical protein n=1 Tax=Aminobacter sp. HY435 TaxID=2970917 RepID=UPI0022B9B36F|nr:hypothetical protein [Aminobacter sp. HY435]
MPLGPALARRRPDAANALLRFSRTVPYLVVAIVVSGIVRIEVRISDFELEKLEGNIEITP